MLRQLLRDIPEVLLLRFVVMPRMSARRIGEGRRLARRLLLANRPVDGRLEPAGERLTAAGCCCGGRSGVGAGLHALLGRWRRLGRGRRRRRRDRRDFLGGYRRRRRLERRQFAARACVSGGGGGGGGGSVASACCCSGSGLGGSGCAVPSAGSVVSGLGAHGPLDARGQVRSAVGVGIERPRAVSRPSRIGGAAQWAYWCRCGCRRWSGRLGWCSSRPLGGGCGASGVGSSRASTGDLDGTAPASCRRGLSGDSTRYRARPPRRHAAADVIATADGRHMVGACA